MPTLSKPLAKKRQSHSSNDDKHPYLKGWKWWSQNKYWTRGGHTPESVAYHEKWLSDLRANEKAFTRL